MSTVTCFGDRTSGTFLIIASVSRTKIIRSHGPITLWRWMFSTVLHLLVYSLTVAFYIISQQSMPVGFNLNLTFGLKPQVGDVKIVTVHKRSIFHVEWLIAALISYNFVFRTFGYWTPSYILVTSWLSNHDNNSKKLFMYHSTKLSLITRERGMWHENARSQNCRGHKRAARVLAVASISGL